LDLFAGPVPTTTITQGDPSIANNDWDSWSLVSGIQFEIFQPLWTFGALGKARLAASEGVVAESSLVERSRWQLRTQIAEFYFGYQLAFELSELALGLESQLSQALKSATARKTRESDLDRLRLGLSEIKARKFEADKALEQIRSGMAWRTGLLKPTGELVVPRWDRANLVRDSRQIPSAEKLRPWVQDRAEFRALEAERSAKLALAQSEKGQLWPALGLVGRGTWTRSPGRLDAESPYWSDPTNESSFFVGLGLRLNLGWFEKNYKASQAHAESLATAARVRHLQAALFADLARSHSELVQWDQSTLVRAEGLQASQRLLNQALGAYLIGGGDAKTLLESLTNHALTKKAYLEALFQHHLAWAKLEQSVGRELQ
jgi:outer membrane protein TolC